ncbi:MAG TPA: FtsX-like permease family protein [Trebonia sp.]|nr:FtsX-like permease family protein [Trebonia sp.]
MIRLGLQLTLHSGREAFVRLLVTAAAVAVGVALLLGVLAEFHAFQANASQPCWSCTQGASVPSALPARGELWNDSVDFYQGQTITRLAVAALGSGAPVPPGIARLPAPGEYYASPALAALLRSVPASELGDRFPGRLAGTIGQPALNGTNDLVIYIGYTPAALKAVPGTSWVTSIATAPPAEVFTSFFRYAFLVGVLAVLFPMLVLISTATRLAADRREERFAALRLVGGTPADIRVIASVEAMVSAFLGAAGGTVIFLLVRPALAGAALIGTPYFESDLTPTAWGYLAMLVGVPLAAAVAALISLRRVQISPLGVSRRATPKPPTFWRLAPLVLGVALFVFGLSRTSRDSIGASAYPGLLITMVGLVIAGPWLTVQAARLFGRAARGSSALLASRRLADNPRAAFRSVTGLILAVFLGTMVGTLIPAVNATEASPSAAALSNVLLDQVGLSPQAGARLLSGLGGINGATVYPLYSLYPQAPPAGSQVKAKPGSGPGDGRRRARGSAGDTVVSCSVMRGLAVLGQCAPGLAAVQADTSSLFSDNPSDNTKPFVSASNTAYTGDLAEPPLQAVLVRVNDPAALERVRTFLAVNAPPQESGGQGQSPTPPRTFGETLQIRLNRAATLEKLVYAGVALTLIVAGCSLAVAVGGGLVDRKRPFTLLRVSGTQVGVLSTVVLLEAAVPLAAATLIAAGIAYGTSMLAFIRLAPAGTAIPQLGHDYYTLMAIGLAAAFAVITVTLPLLNRMTAPNTVRFE